MTPDAAKAGIVECRQTVNVRAQMRRELTHHRPCVGLMHQDVSPHDGVKRPIERDLNRITLATPWR